MHGNTKLKKEETHIWELNSIHVTCNSIIHCLRAIKFSILDVGSTASVCGLTNTPS